MRSPIFAIFTMLPAGLSAAPVPAHLMPRIEVEVRHLSSEHPLGKAFTVLLQNRGGASLTVRTDRPDGLAALFEVEIRTDGGERIACRDPWNAPAEANATTRDCAVIPAGETFSIRLPLFEANRGERLAPGRYQVRVCFRYRDQTSTSNWEAVTLTEADLRTGFLVGRP